MTLPQTLTAILGWLRAGYPEGVPPQDYFPLLALLGRQLSEDEVQQILATLVEEGDDVTKVDIAVAVTKVTNEMPGEGEIQRVAHRLAQAGYPVESGLTETD